MGQSSTCEAKEVIHQANIAANAVTSKSCCVELDPFGRRKNVKWIIGRSVDAPHPEELDGLDAELVNQDRLFRGDLPWEDAVVHFAVGLTHCAYGTEPGTDLHDYRAATSAESRSVAGPRSVDTSFAPGVVWPPAKLNVQAGQLVTSIDEHVVVGPLFADPAGELMRFSGDEELPLEFVDSSPSKKSPKGVSRVSCAAKLLEERILIDPLTMVEGDGQPLVRVTGVALQSSESHKSLSLARVFLDQQKSNHVSHHLIYGFGEEGKPLEDAVATPLVVPEDHFKEGSFSARETGSSPSLEGKVQDSGADAATLDDALAAPKAPTAASTVSEGTVSRQEDAQTEPSRRLPRKDPKKPKAEAAQKSLAVLEAGRRPVAGKNQFWVQAEFIGARDDSPPVELDYLHRIPQIVGIGRLDSKNQLKCGDFLLEVNGILAKDKEAFLAELHSADILDLLVARHPVHKASLNKQACGGSVGLNISRTPQGISLLVESLKPGGAAELWNNTCPPAKQIMADDRIMGVSGVETTSADALGKAIAMAKGTVEVLICRSPEVLGA